MQKWLVISFVWWCSISSIAQVDTSLLITRDYFINPVDHTIKLAGSFGELRSNHFHAGIDIKSRKGISGDTLMAAAEGFVSRIKTQRGSYGKALYIDHPNGYTTVYAHMQKFSPKIEAYLREQQRAAQSYEVDIYPSADKLPLAQGEHIGMLGNTGRSYGPHLHFEIRETATEIPQNPYLHGIGPSDSKPPLLYAVSAQGVDRDLQKINTKTAYINLGKNGAYAPEHTFEVPAWRAGMAIQSFDLMDGSSNKNGLYHLKMYVDDTLHYEMKMDSIGFDETRYINSFIEYEEKKDNNRTLIRCYRQLNNPLRLYQKTKNNGFFKIYKDVPRRVRFEARDIYGNLSTYECKVVRREATEKDITNASYSQKIRYNEAYDLSMGLCNIKIPEGATDNTLLLNYAQSYDKGIFSFELGKKSQPLFKKITVSIPLKGVRPELRHKAVLVYNEGKKPTSFGGDMMGDSLVSKVDKLGGFSLEIDSIPPQITPLEYKKNASGRSDFKFRLDDNYNTRGGAKDIIYSVYIDGVWTISPLKALGDILTVPLEDVVPGDHTIRIDAGDHSGNTTSWRGSFSR